MVPTKEQMHQWYVVEQKSYRQIMKLTGIKNNRRIPKLLNEYDIPIRRGSEAVKSQWVDNPKRRKQQGEVFRKAHLGTVSPRRIADEIIYDRLATDGLKFISSEVIDGYSYYTYICESCGYIGVKSSRNVNYNGCPSCATNSKGELKIKEWLKENNVKFKEQYKFDDCKNKLPLPFDFAIFNKRKLSMLIEYDGIQHFEPSELFGGEVGFEERKRNDIIKNEYCNSKGIKLVRIPYWDYKSLDSLLAEIIC